MIATHTFAAMARQIAPNKDISRLDAALKKLAVIFKAGLLRNHALKVFGIMSVNKMIFTTALADRRYPTFWADKSP